MYLYTFLLSSVINPIENSLEKNFFFSKNIFPQIDHLYDIGIYNRCT